MESNYKYECTLAILIENQPSILTRIVALLSRRGFVIDSLAVGPTEYESLFRVIIVLDGNLRLIDQVTRQIYKIFPVVKVYNLTAIPSITRELILYKILVDDSERRRVLEIANVFKANVIDYTSKTITLEVTGDLEKIVAVEQMLHQFGILEIVRTGRIGLTKESITIGQLYTVERERLRKTLANNYINELENKIYL